MKPILILAAALLLTGCAGFTLGSFNYCAKDTECASSARPFRPGAAVPAGAAGQATGTPVPLVSAPASAPRPVQRGI
jgi:hypothetical protein